MNNLLAIRIITMTRGRARIVPKSAGTKSSTEGRTNSRRHYEEFGEAHPIDEKESKVKRLKVRINANVSSVNALKNNHDRYVLTVREEAPLYKA